MAEKISIYDFLNWCVQIIDPAELSALMSNCGFPNDDVENIIDGLQNDQSFVADFGSLLAEGLKANNEQLNRAIGGVHQSNDELTLSDWAEIVTHNEITRATGSVADTNVNSGVQPFDWNGLVGGILAIAGGVLGGTSKTTTTTGANKTPTTTTGSSTALYIIIAVVVIAVIGILWLSLSGGKK